MFVVMKPARVSRFTQQVLEKLIENMFVVLRLKVPRRDNSVAMEWALAQGYVASIDFDPNKVVNDPTITNLAAAQAVEVSEPLKASAPVEPEPEVIETKACLNSGSRVTWVNEVKACQLG